MFIINSVILIVYPEPPFRTLRVVLKAETDLFMVVAAMLGTMHYPTKRNRLGVIN